MFKDEWISKRHRLWGYNVPVVDVDYLSIKYNKIIEFKEKKGIKLIEKKLKQNKGAGTNYTATQELCDNSNLEYYVAAYDDKRVVVYPSNDLAKSKYFNNFKIPKNELENWIKGNYEPQTFSLKFNMLKAINKTYKPKYTKKKFDYEVLRERTSWRDKELDDLIKTNDVDSFLGLEYDKGSPVMLVEYIDTSKSTNTLEDRNVDISKLNIPLIYFKYNSEVGIKKNRIRIELSAGNQDGKILLKSNKIINFNNGKANLIESEWIKFLYSSRGYEISDEFLQNIQKAIGDSIKSNNNNINNNIK